MLNLIKTLHLSADLFYCCWIIHSSVDRRWWWWWWRTNQL